MNLFTRILLVSLISLSIVNCKNAPEDSTGDSLYGKIDLFTYDPNAPLCTSINKTSLAEDITCNCSPEDYSKANSDQVVGTALYHISSEICSAAKHSNLIQKTKSSTVIIKPGQQCNYFVGSTLNGLASLTRVLSGNEPTFYFKGFNDGLCPELPNKSHCASQTVSWTVNSQTCSANLAEYNSVNGGTGDANDSDGASASPTGSAVFTCSGNSWSSLPLQGATCLKVDTDPNAFTFAQKNNVTPNTLITSGTVQLVGFNTATAITVSNGSYRIHDGTAWSSWIASQGTINYGNKLQLAHMASNNQGVAVTTLVSVGTINSSFTSQTIVYDTNPNQFSFARKDGVNINTVQYSEAVEPTGFNTNALVNITTTGSFRIQKGTTWGNWQTTQGTLNVGNKLQISHLSSNSNNIEVTSQITVGTTVALFISKTKALDPNPNPFHFDDVVNAGTLAYIESNFRTISGIDTPAPVTITGGSFSIYDGHNWSSWATSANILNGYSIKVAHKASSNFNTITTTRLTIGTVSDDFTSTTRNGFNYVTVGSGTYNFTEVNQVNPGALVTSQQMQIIGLGTIKVCISISGSHSEEFRIYYKNELNQWGWSVWGSSTELQVADRNIIQVRHRASAANSTTVTSTLLVGTAHLIFKSTTKAP